MAAQAEISAASSVAGAAATSMTAEAAAAVGALEKITPADVAEGVEAVGVVLVGALTMATGKIGVSGGAEAAKMGARSSIVTTLAAVAAGVVARGLEVEAEGPITMVSGVDGKGGGDGYCIRVL